MYLPLPISNLDVNLNVNILRWVIGKFEKSSASSLPVVTYGEEQDGTVVDSILQWLARLFSEIGNFFVGIYPTVAHAVKEAFNSTWQWISRTWPKVVHFIAENGGKAWQSILVFLHAADEYLIQHRYMALFVSLLLFVGPWILMLPVFLFQALIYVVLSTLGFGLSGITGGSPAAHFQSVCYGPHTPAASMFAILQSAGTHYNVRTTHPVLLVIRILAGLFCVYVLFIAFIL